jgi:hypothetical protein
MNASRRVVAICAATPAFAAVAFSAALVVPAVSGHVPSFWRGGLLTMSEAAALRDAGVVVQLIGDGEDPNATYSLRPDVLAVQSATPLEAAVGARRAEIIELLMTHGAKIAPAAWGRLHCFALNTGAGDVVQAVDRYRPEGVADASCDGVATPF